MFDPHHVLFSSSLSTFFSPVMQTSPLDEMCYEVGRRGGRGNWGIGKQRRQIILRSFSSVIWFKNMFWNYYPCQCCILPNIVCSFYADLLPSQWDVLRGKGKRWRKLGNRKTVLSDNITILHSQTIFRVFSWYIWYRYRASIFSALDFLELSFFSLLFF